MVIGLGDTDALLNIQPGGAYFASDKVSVFATGPDSYNISIDLADIAAGTSAALFFDLVRFGQTGSAATIGNLQLISRPGSTPAVEPTVSAGGNATANQGDSFTRSGSFRDPDGADVWSAVVDYGDGEGFVPLALDGTRFTLDHIFKRAGIFTVTVAVTDSSGARGVSSFNLNVANLAPVVGPLPNLQGKPGDSVNITTTATDAGGDTLTARIDWGDGQAEDVTVDRETGAISRSHSYAAIGLYHAVLSVTDGTATTPSNFDVLIQKDATSALISGPGAIEEGSVYVLNLGATGPEAAAIQSWTINWGDGTTEVLAGDAQVAMHIYTKGNRMVTISAFATDGISNFGANTLPVTVTNAAPQITGVGASGGVIEGGATRVSGTFADRGQDDGHRAVIHWGDGTTDTLTLLPGETSFSFVHPYAGNRPGNAPFAVSVEIMDDSGAQASRSLSLTVLNGPPTTSASGPASGLINQVLQFLGAAGDPGPTDTVQISWNFGDGRVLGFASSSDPRNLAPSHTYALPGTYYITLTARDSDGATGSSIIPVVIDGIVPPSSPGSVFFPASRVGGGGGAAALGPVSGPSSLALFNFFSGHILEAFLIVNEWSAAGQPWAVSGLSWESGEITIPEAGLEPWADSLYALVERVYSAPGAAFRIEEFSIARTDGSLVVTIRFNSGTGGDLHAGDLEISVDGVPVDPSTVKFSHDPTDRTAVWTAAVDAGTVRVDLKGDSVHDAGGHALDGDQDGLDGGDFIREVRVAPESE